MTPAWSSRRWRCETSGQSALELIAPAASAEGIDGAIEHAFGEYERPAFLLITVSAAGSKGLGHVVDALAHVELKTRVCVAVDAATLAQARSVAMDHETVGLMLDDVNVTTPLAAIISDRIEAVRYRPAFIDQASKALRHGSALQAMLDLSRDLGLCTFGMNVSPGGASISGWCEFDYVPAPVMEARSEIQRAHRAPNAGRHSALSR